MPGAWRLSATGCRCGMGSNTQLTPRLSLPSAGTASPGLMQMSILASLLPSPPAANDARLILSSDGDAATPFAMARVSCARARIEVGGRVAVWISGEVQVYRCRYIYTNIICIHIYVGPCNYLFHFEAYGLPKQPPSSVCWPARVQQKCRPLSGLLPGRLGS